jgi:hypothetical protein
MQAALNFWRSHSNPPPIRWRPCGERWHNGGYLLEASNNLVSHVPLREGEENIQ